MNFGNAPQSNDKPSSQEPLIRLAEVWQLPTEPLEPNEQNELTDQELKELDSAALERYRVKDRPFPEAMADEAFYGLAGDIVKIISPHTEACREAILAQLLVAIGNQLGRGAYRRQAAIHHLNEYAVLVGDTSLGRKGTSWEAVYNLLSAIDEDWLTTRTFDGVQSGEAIVHAIRDPVYGIIPVNKRKAGQADQAETTLIDQGVEDKRLLLIEEEFARLLTVASRPGNTISSTLRKGWDSKKRLTVEGKIAPARATNPHVSMLGHITSDELLSCLNEIENKNGFSNRVLWLATYRTQELSIPPWINWDKYPDIVGRLAEIVKIFGTHALSREFNWSSEGEKEWDKFYKSVKCSGSGIVGSILARSHAHVLRLTMLFAVLDNSSLMEPQYLRAAIAFWQYCVRSAMWIFGEKTGNKSADKIYWALQRAPGGMTRTDITADVFNRHVSKVTLDQALSELVKTGLARFASERVKGDRPAQRWFAKTE